tara:strand:+ start:3438 stop:4037 length:600 start_codon:yes stop_codon:yes gene_type:complete
MSMAAFTRANYKEYPPEEFVAGDYLAWKNTSLVSDYPVASYALTYDASFEGTKIAITALEDAGPPEAYYVEVGAAVTALYTPGTYVWSAFITDSSDATKRIQVDYGTWTVTPNLAVSTADPRSHNEIILDALEALLETRATVDQASYSIAGRSLSRMDVDDLLRWKAIYTWRVRREVQLERIRNGQRPGNTIDVRFVNR